MSTQTDTNINRSLASQEAEGLVIVGGGIAGLACALALKLIAGISSIHVLEKVNEHSFQNERAGAGAQIGPNGLKALRAIGGEALMKEVLDAGAKLSGNTICMAPPQGAMHMPDSAEADTGLPQVLLGWGKLRAILASHVPSESITYDQTEEFTGFAVTEEGVKLTSKSGIQVGPSVSPLIIGADGINSTIGRSINNTKIIYNNRINIKAIVKAELGNDCKPGYTNCYFAPDGSVACFAGPAGEGLSYWAISIKDEEKDKEVLSELLNVSRPQKDLDRSAVKEKLLKLLQSMNEPLCQFAMDIVTKTESEYIYIQRGEQMEEVGPNLSTPDRKVVLVGDAAHAFSMSYGQAMSFALEDAATLAVCMRDADDIETAVKCYEKSRMDRCIEMEQRSKERMANRLKGVMTEDVSKWIFQWDI